MAEVPAIEVQLIGVTQVRTGERVLQGRDFGGAKPRQLLELLALQVGTPVSKDRLADLLWDGAAPPSSITTLEGYVSLLRGRLQPGVATRSSVVRTVQGGYVLDAAQVRVDSRTVQDLVLQARGTRPAACLALLREALAAGAGDLLAGSGSAAWVTAARHAHDRLLVEAGTRAAQQALQLGQPEVAVTLADGVLDRNALAEEACRCAMQGLWSTGRSGEALRRHSTLRSVLADELGIDPSPATQALLTSLLRDEPAAAAPFRRRGTDLPLAAVDRAPRQVDVLTGALVAALRRNPTSTAADEDTELLSLLEGVLRHLRAEAPPTRLVGLRASWSTHRPAVPCTAATGR